MYEVYKVLTVEKDGLYSYNYSDSPTSKINRLRLKYEVGEATFPTIPNSLLFAFSELQDAIKFCQFEDRAVIYKALTPWYNTTYPQIGNYDQILDFWQTYKSPSDSFRNKYNIITGLSSIACPSLILTEKVDV